jgi:hypothetical protein
MQKVNDTGRFADQPTSEECIKVSQISSHEKGGNHDHPTPQK